jgi:putative oxidoreductase
MTIDTLTQFLPDFLDGKSAWALLGLRLIWGIALMVNGLPMIRHPRHWMDLGGKPSGFPGLLQAIGALAVFGGGLAIVVGFLTPLAALGLVAAMVVALILHLQHGEPFVKQPPTAPGDSYEASLVYLAVAALFMILGPGIFSLDALLFDQNGVFVSLW